MVTDLLQQLGITVVRREGGQLLCHCPSCESDHLYVNPDSGLWDCKKGCGNGNAIGLVRFVLPGITPADAMSMLSSTDTQNGGTPPPQEKPKELYLKKEQLRHLSDEDIDKFCEVKNIDRESFLSLGPVRYKDTETLVIPAFTPGQDKMCGGIRANIDGSKVKLKDREEKYPVVAGSRKGLLGLKTLQNGSGWLVWAEGWRDCLAARSLSYEAVAGSQGCNAWDDNWLSVFKDRKVAIIFDADKPGQRAAWKMANKLRDAVAEVRVCRLPYTIAKTSGKDLHDWVREDRHTANDLMELIETGQEVEPTDESSDVVILDDLNADTIAIAYDEQANGSYLYHPDDGWSLYKANKYMEIIDEQVTYGVNKYARRCHVEKETSDGIQLRRCKVNRSLLKDVVHQIALMPHVSLKPDQRAPCSLDGRMDIENIIACKNCLVDIGHWPPKTYPHTPNLYTRNYLSYDYDPKATCDEYITKFLPPVLCNDGEMHDLMQMWCGYLFIRSLRFQKFMLCIGTGENGKSKLCEIIRHLVGNHNVSAIPLFRMGDKHSLATTYGKMVNMSTESSMSLQDHSETVLKEYSAGDMMVFEHKYHDPFYAVPTAKLMFSSNNRPNIRDTSDGVWRRMLYVPFDAKFEGDNDDKWIADRIIANELPGVLNWALEGAHNLMENKGFIIPQRTKDEVSDYKMMAHPARIFIEDAICADDSGNAKVSCTDLYAQYREWCECNGHKPSSNTVFGREVKSVFPKVDRIRTNDYNGNRVYEYIHIRYRCEEGVDEQV